MLENEDENTHNVLMTLWDVGDGFHHFCHQYCESVNHEVANIATRYDIRDIQTFLIIHIA